MSVQETLQRRVLPRTIVALSRMDAPHRSAAAARRACGGSATVRLFFAFDDPHSAVAVLGLARRLGGRRAALRLEPVVARGIAEDPAAQAKREFALTDARRLAARDHHTLSRTSTIPARDTAFLAAWTAALPHEDGSRTAFATAAMRELWLVGDRPIPRDRLAALWHAHGGGAAADPPETHAGVAAAERTARRRGFYDTPIAVVHGQWFFAHERLEQIVTRLDELGWTAPT